MVPYHLLKNQVYTKKEDGTARHVAFCQNLKGEVNEQGKVDFIIALLFSFIKINLTIRYFYFFSCNNSYRVQQDC